ncbi:MAG: sialidase family protein [Gaiellaceae bacterium]
MKALVCSFRSVGRARRGTFLRAGAAALAVIGAVGLANALRADTRPSPLGAFALVREEAAPSRPASPGFAVPTLGGVPYFRSAPTGPSATSASPTFGQPTISGIQGSGFEQDLRLDLVSDPNRIYTSVPGALSSDDSWIWYSKDGGRTFKFVPASKPKAGKPVECAGGGDTELAVDVRGRLYFADLTLANFSTSRSDDGGRTFPGCSNTGVPASVVDRQWYTIDGDPLALGPDGPTANTSTSPRTASCRETRPVPAASRSTTNSSCSARSRAPVPGSSSGLSTRSARRATRRSWATSR